MKIEVFKDYEQALRLFDSVRYNDNEPPSQEDFVGWQFNSENRTDYDEYINDMAPGDQSPDTIYFDSTQGDYKLASTVKNIVLDYRAPEMVSWSGKYTAFNGEKWIAELTFRDDSGIDDGAYSIFCTTSSQELVTSTRQNSSAPYWPPTVTYNDSLVPDHSAISVQFTKSSAEASVYRVILEVDPSKLSSNALVGCNDSISYMKLGMKIYDIAGNELVCTIPVAFVLYKKSAEDILADIKRLKIDFIDTYPPNLFVDKDVIGKTTARALSENPSLHEIGFEIKFGLSSDSVGYLSGIPEVDEDGDKLTSLQNIDGIDRSGNVKVFAYLDGSNDGNLFCTLSEENIQVEVDRGLAEKIKADTRAEAVLGTFIAECESNERKLNLDPFIPGVLKGESIYGLCKLYEKFLNTMYNPVGASCKIGVMEKISRVGKFKDADSCEAKLLPRFFEEHGSELKFNRDDLKSAAETILKHLPYNTQVTTDDVLDSIYRRYAAILPYIDRWKGTNRSFDLLFKAIGIQPRVEYLWEDERGNLVSEEEASDEYTLSSHLRIVLSSDLYTKAELNSLVPFTYKAVESVLPVTRVLEDVYIQENYTAVDHNESMTIIDCSIAGTSVQNNQIKFAWNARSLKPAKITSDWIVIKIPVRSYKTESDLIDTEFPIQDNCSFYFKRWDLTRETMADKTLKLTFKRNSNVLTDLYIDPISVVLERDSVVLRGLSTASNVQAANSINMYRLDDTVDLEATFKYNRAVENYCVSVLAH